MVNSALDTILDGPRGRFALILLTSGGDMFGRHRVDGGCWLTRAVEGSHALACHDPNVCQPARMDTGKH